MAGRTIRERPGNGCTNTSQPGLETLLQIANVLDVDVKDLLHSTKEDTMYFKVPTNFTI